MQLEIVGKKGRVLRSIAHNGQVYVEAPKVGEYVIRLRNTSAVRRKAVVSVDGVNVLDGKDAGFDGRGYVLRPWETIDIPGWMRTDSTCAKFEFKEQGGSYAAQTGRGTSNVGVIGVAVFDELVTYRPTTIIRTQTTFLNNTYQPENYGSNHINIRGASDGTRFSRMYMDSEPDSDTYATKGTKGIDPRRMQKIGEVHDVPRGGSGMLRQRAVKSDDTLGDTFCATNMGPTAAAASASSATMDFMEQDMERGVVDHGRGIEQKTSGGLFNEPVKDVGTAYGKEAAFHTHTTIFNQASSTPVLIVSVRYATRERLLSWGVPIDDVVSAPKQPNAFPMSQPAAVPAPPGWRG